MEFLETNKEISMVASLDQKTSLKLLEKMNLKDVHSVKLDQTGWSGTEMVRRSVSVQTIESG